MECPGELSLRIRGSSSHDGTEATDGRNWIAKILYTEAEPNEVKRIGRGIRGDARSRTSETPGIRCFRASRKLAGIPNSRQPAPDRCRPERTPLWSGSHVLSRRARRNRFVHDWTTAVVLAVLELKATEDIHLPLQALDYWARVKWHQERGEFEAKGYFPGRAIRPAAPKLSCLLRHCTFIPQQKRSCAIDIRSGGGAYRAQCDVALRSEGCLPRPGERTGPLGSRRTQSEKQQRFWVRFGTPSHI